MARNKGGTESLRRKINAVNGLKKGLPIQAANVAKNFFVKRFSEGGWYDQNFQKWKSRKGELARGVANLSKKDPASRALLVKSGNLRKSIFIAWASWNRIRIESDLPYSAIHNEGLTGMAFGKHKFQMPKRKFMGNSYFLRKKVRELLETRINAAMRK